MGSKRRHERHVRRLELEFSASGKTYRAISSDFSCNGLFIRTNHAFAPGSRIQITVYLPDATSSALAGVVRRAIKTPTISLKNGMGIEITQSDDNYQRFMAAFDDGCHDGMAERERPAASAPGHARTTGPAEAAAAEFAIVPCPGCGVKNKIKTSKMSLNPKCGRCGATINEAPKTSPAPERPRTASAAGTPPHGSFSPVAPPGGAGYGTGSLIAGRYQIQEICGGEGKSAMGIVYVCFDLEAGAVLALKTLQKRFQDSKKIVDSFKKEALAWIHLGKHPHIVRAYWARELDHRMFIACEYVSPDGLGRNSVTPYLKGPLSLGQILTWSIQFCYGMEYACAKGVTPHRDIKPDNIMISMDGVVKITDFGLVGLWDKAEGLEEIRDAMGKNQEGLTFLTHYNNRIVAGSPPWMAPEQFYGISKISSDIYSFGVVLFQMVNNGELPWRPRKGDNWGVVHKTYPLPPVPRRGAELEHIIKKCLEKRRDRRYQDFGELRHDLEEVFRREITRKTGEILPERPVEEDLKESELVNKGMSLANLGLIEEGIRNYREGLKINPQNAPARYNLGNALAQKGLLDEAIREYREAIRIDADMTAARFNLGIALFKKGKLDEAIREYKETLRRGPESADVYVNLGVALHKKGLVGEAIKAYREAVRLRPSFADAHYKLGIALFSNDMIEESIGAFREAVGIRPDYAEAHNNLGTALLKKGLTDEAIGSYGKAVAHRSGYAEAYYNLGMAFMRRNLSSEAINALEECVKCGPKHSARAAKAREMIASLRSRQ